MITKTLTNDGSFFHTTDYELEFCTEGMWRYFRIPARVQKIKIKATIKDKSKDNTFHKIDFTGPCHDFIDGKILTMYSSVKNNIISYGLGKVFWVQVTVIK